MASNFWWLFAAYTIVWGALFLYAARLTGKLRKLEAELAKLAR